MSPVRLTRAEVRALKDAARFRSEYTAAAWIPTFEDAHRYAACIVDPVQRGLALSEIWARWPDRLWAEADYAGFADARLRARALRLWWAPRKPGYWRTWGVLSGSIFD